MIRRRLLPSVLLAFVVAVLAFAASASAEVRTGEATSPVDEGLAGELDLLAASAYYDSSLGTVEVTATVREAPTSNPEVQVQAALFPAPPEDCSVNATPAYPAFLLFSPYSQPTAAWFFLEEEGEMPSAENAGEASKTVTDTKTTFATTTPLASGRPFDCALVGIGNGEPTPIDAVAFPIKVPTPPAPPVTPTVTPAPTATPPPPAAQPPGLSIGKAKPLRAKAGKWTNLKLTVSNPGGTAAGPVTVKLKAPAGVVLMGSTVKLPALLPGQSWPITIAAKLTAAAKKSSTISVTATMAGLVAKGAVALKLLDG